MMNPVMIRCMNCSYVMVSVIHASCPMCGNAITRDNSFSWTLWNRQRNMNKIIRGGTRYGKHFGIKLDSLE